MASCLLRRSWSVQHQGLQLLKCSSPLRFKSNVSENTQFNPITILPQKGDFKNTISMNDYAKLTMTHTSFNLTKIAGTSTISILTASPLMHLVDPVTLVCGSCISAFGLALYSIFQMDKYALGNIHCTAMYSVACI